MIDAAVDAGANQVAGPNLARSDESALYRQALRAAIRCQGQGADDREGFRSHPAPDHGRDRGRRSDPVPPAAKPGDTSSTPVEPGTQLVAATVTVTFSVT